MFILILYGTRQEDTVANAAYMYAGQSHLMLQYVLEIVIMRANTYDKLLPKSIGIPCDQRRCTSLLTDNDHLMTADKLYICDIRICYMNTDDTRSARLKARSLVD